MFSDHLFPTPVKAVIQQTLPVLRDIVDSISGESTKSRQICYQSLQESVQVSLSLFPVFIQQPGQCLSSVQFDYSMKMIQSIHSLFCTYLSCHMGTEAYPLHWEDTCRDVSQLPTRACMIITLRVTKDQIHIIIQSKH